MHMHSVKIFLLQSWLCYQLNHIIYVSGALCFCGREEDVWDGGRQYVVPELLQFSLSDFTLAVSFVVSSVSFQGIDQWLFFITFSNLGLSSSESYILWCWLQKETEQENWFLLLFIDRKVLADSFMVSKLRVCRARIANESEMNQNWKDLC